MITCEFAGRLANNLFQIATTYGLADKFKESAEFDSYTQNEAFSQYYAGESDKLTYPDFNLPKRTKKHQNTYFETPHGYQEIEWQPDLMLSGFFQTEKYFTNVRDLLIESVFKVPNTPIKDSIAVHVRRGDYLAYANTYPLCPVEYYLNALEELNFKGKKIIIFSDDISFCKETFINLPNIEFSENTVPILDLFQMAQCENFILSNSSFSWWGAWLSRFKQKVICPTKEKWFHESVEIERKDIIPDNWNQLAY